MSSVPVGIDACSAWLDATDFLDRDAFEELLLRAGRIYGPTLLTTAFMDGKIDDETLSAVIGDVWSMAEYPDKAIGHGDWRWLFDVAGYTINGRRSERPCNTLTLYRGSVPERRSDWSWTDNVEVARKFAAGIRGRRPGDIWVCSVPPRALLCRNSGRQEDEYVVDTAGLVIRRIEGEC